MPPESNTAAPLQIPLRPLSAAARSALLLAAGGALLGPAAAQSSGAEPGLALQPSLQLQERLPGGRELAGPTFLLGDRIEGQTDVQTRVEGHAELRRHDLVLKADRLEHQVANDTVHASGGVRVNRLGNIYQGSELKLKLDSNEGYFLQPRFTLLKNGGQGEASRLDFLGPNQSSAERAVYSTCSRPDSGPWKPDWWLSASRMEFDTATDTGTAHGGVLHFKGLPILGAPYVEFPLSDQRRSGLLPPSLNIATQSGIEVALPYYLNLAPRRDATLTPTLMSKRGVDLGGEFRYLESDFSGELSGAYMPGDKLRDADRWSASIQHRQGFSSVPGIDHLGLRLNLNRVSDDNYWRDFPRAGKGLGLTQRLLPSEAVLNWGRGDWSFSAGSYSWQTLQDPAPAAQIVAPYDRVPSLAARLAPAPFSLAGNPDWEGSLQTELTRFATDRTIQIGDGKSATVLGGDRALVLAQLSKTWQAPGWFVKPGLQLHARQYQFDQAIGSGQSSQGLALPTLSLDSGLFFERDARFFGRDLVQTLEPRLYYSRTPYREQGYLPSYDNAPFGFSLATVYLPNPYAGNDRIADLDALTLGATTRLLQPETGAELLSLGIAQRYRFREQRVTLPGESTVASGLTDLLLGARVQWTPQWSASAELQYNPESGESTRSTLGLRYLPGPYRVLNAGYRVKQQSQQSASDASRQLDLGWQWPLQALFGTTPAGVAGRGLGPQQWYSVGRINYSLPESRIVDLLAGFEYDAGCWIGRVVVERLQNSTSSANQRIMFQLEFSDFTRIGSSPLQSLRNNVPRYQYLREEINPPSRFERYE
ncbi:LPS assembly protein LptD [Malikia sp.]|uniref:LPS-assembly protein LptD n=1 Tax=Malikia sp. TaxID=2070706 RepID=UPI0026313AEC|nr:LPS assembly protein LptD [Malikia sp.]MDD2729864.1 LPS assembly protein LptD [Malikia sp.]